MPTRPLRWPANAADFNQLNLLATVAPVGVRMWNLRWEAHLTPATVFFASKSGRLTPDSGTVKCLYLAEDPATSFYEIYGDDVAAAKAAGVALTMSRQTMIDRVFAIAPAGFTSRFYDLTMEGSAKRVGLDLATLYSADVDRPRRFAQCLHDHPAKLDGIRYISRHTQRVCFVLWPTYNPTLTAMVLTRSGTLWEHATYSPTAAPGRVMLFDDSIAVATP